jgi:hypothetical protein
MFDKLPLELAVKHLLSTQPAVLLPDVVWLQQNICVSGRPSRLAL